MLNHIDGPRATIPYCTFVLASAIFPHVNVNICFRLHRFGLRKSHYSWGTIPKEQNTEFYWLKFLFSLLFVHPVSPFPWSGKYNGRMHIGRLGFARQRFGHFNKKKFFSVAFSWGSLHFGPAVREPQFVWVQMELLLQMPTIISIKIRNTNNRTIKIILFPYNLRDCFGPMDAVYTIFT